MISILSKFRSFNKKEENKELILHSLVALLVRLGGAAAAFLMNIVVARYLGVEQSGYFFLAITVTTIFATIGRIGADQAVLRYVSISSENRKWGEINALLKTITKWSLAPVLIITFLICIFSKTISINIFQKPEFEKSLFWTSLSMPFFAIYNIFGMALQGRKKVLLSVTSLKILTPVFLIFFIVIFSLKKDISICIFYTIACILAAALSYFWYRKNVPNNKGSFNSSLLWKSCVPLWIVAIMQQMVTWGGQFIAGIFNNSQELAQLAVARNTSVLISFVLTAVNYVSAPRFATMYNQGKLAELKQYAKNSTRLMTILALPLIVFIWIFPNLIMSLFGHGFTGGIWLLRILAVGQFVNVITGSVGYLLIMSGHEKDLRNITIINGTLAIVLAFILNPLFGATGSAISTAIAIASSNFMAVSLVKKRLGFNILSILGF